MRASDVAQAAEAGLSRHAGFVHERAIEIGELAAFGMSRIVRIDAFDRVAKLRLRGFAQLRERVPGAAVGRDRRRRKPFAVGELPEIVLRPDRGIDRGEVDAGARLRPSSRRTRRCRSRKRARIVGAWPQNRPAARIFQPARSSRGPQSPRAWSRCIQPIDAGRKSVSVSRPGHTFRPGADAGRAAASLNRAMIDADMSASDQTSQRTPPPAAGSPTSPICCSPSPRCAGPAMPSSAGSPPVIFRR